MTKKLLIFLFFFCFFSGVGRRSHHLTVWRSSVVRPDILISVLLLFMLSYSFLYKNNWFKRLFRRHILKKNENIKTETLFPQIQIYFFARLKSWPKSVLISKKINLFIKCERNFKLLPLPLYGNNNSFLFYIQFHMKVSRMFHAGNENIEMFK